MHFQIDVSSSLPQTSSEPPAAPATAAPEAVELLRQLLEVQKEQLAYQRAAAAAHDLTSRWKAFLARWQDEFPGLPEACRKALPLLERCYGRMIAELTERVNEVGDDLENDFTVQEFLDRYGMRLAQLGTILNLVAPLSEAGPAGETG
jgi:hypothetical protein